MNSDGQGELENPFITQRERERELLHEGAANQEETFFPNDCKGHGLQKLHRRVINMDKTTCDSCIHGNTPHCTLFMLAMFVAGNKEFWKMCLWSHYRFSLKGERMFLQRPLCSCTPRSPTHTVWSHTSGSHSVPRSGGFAGQHVWGELSHLPIPSVFAHTVPVCGCASIFNIIINILWSIMRSHVSNLDDCLWGFIFEFVISQHLISSRGEAPTIKKHHHSYNSSFRCNIQRLEPK